MSSIKSGFWACLRFFFFFTSVKNTWFPSPPSTAHTFPFAAYWNKLHPHVGHTHRFNSVSEQLHVNCLQSYINLNAHLKYLWKSCAKYCHYLPCVHRAVVGCNTTPLNCPPWAVSHGKHLLSCLSCSICACHCYPQLKITRYIETSTPPFKIKLLYPYCWKLILA